MGAITFTINTGITNEASVKLSDKDGYSYVLINGQKIKDADVAKDDNSMFTSGSLSVTAAVPVDNSDPRTPTEDEYGSIAGSYKVVITGTNHTKLSTTSGAAAIAVDLYEKYASGDSIPDGKQVGDYKDPVELKAGNSIEVAFTVTRSGIQLDSTTIYAAVQGGASEETTSTFTSNKPTAATKLYFESATNTWTEITTGA